MFYQCLFVRPDSVGVLTTTPKKKPSAAELQLLVKKLAKSMKEKSTVFSPSVQEPSDVISEATSEVKLASKRKTNSSCRGPPISKQRLLQHEQNLREKRSAAEQLAESLEPIVIDDDQTPLDKPPSDQSMESKDEIKFTIINLKSQKMKEEINDVPLICISDSDDDSEDYTKDPIKLEDLSVNSEISNKSSSSSSFESEISFPIKKEIKQEQPETNESPQHFQDLRLPYVKFITKHSNSKKLSSILKHSKGQPSNKVKRFRFSKVGSVKFIEYKKSFKCSLLEHSKCKKRFSHPVEPTEDELRVNKSLKPIYKKYSPVSCDPYLVDAINSPEDTPDPPVLETNVNRSKPNLTINTVDKILVSTRTPSVHILPSPAKFIVDLSDSTEVADLDLSIDDKTLFEDTEETMFVDFMISDNGSDYPGRKTPFMKDCCFGLLDEDPFWFKMYDDEDLDYSLVHRIHQSCSTIIPQTNQEDDSFWSLTSGNDSDENLSKPDSSLLSTTTCLDSPLTRITTFSPPGTPPPSRSIPENYSSPGSDSKSTPTKSPKSLSSTLPVLGSISLSPIVLSSTENSPESRISLQYNSPGRTPPLSTSSPSKSNPLNFSYSPPKPPSKDSKPSPPKPTFQNSKPNPPTLISKLSSNIKQYFDPSSRSIVFNTSQVLGSCSSSMEQTFNSTPKATTSKENSDEIEEVPVPPQNEPKLHTKQVLFNEMVDSNSEPRRFPKSRSNHEIQTPEFTDNLRDRINTKLGSDFYDKYPWISRKKPQWHPSERLKLISIMGKSASQIEARFPPWWNFLTPANETDRKNFSITVNGVTLVSISKAVRNTGINFINSDSVLDICPVCNSVMNHKYLVFMKYIVWNEEYTGSDIIDWQTNDDKACFIHWRRNDAEKTPNRNPWTIGNIPSKKFSFKPNFNSRARSPSPLGPAVLPTNLL